MRSSAERVDVDGHFPPVFRHVGQRFVAGDASVVDDDVAAAHGFELVGNQQGFRAGNIAAAFRRRWILHVFQVFCRRGISRPSTVAPSRAKVQ